MPQCKSGFYITPSGPIDAKSNGKKIIAFLYELTEYTKEQMELVLRQSWPIHLPIERFLTKFVRECGHLPDFKELDQVMSKASDLLNELGIGCTYTLIQEEYHASPEREKELDQV